MTKAKRKARRASGVIDQQKFEIDWRNAMSAKDPAEQPTDREQRIMNLARALFVEKLNWDMGYCLEKATEAMQITEKWLKQRRKK